MKNQNLLIVLIISIFCLGGINNSFSQSKELNKQLKKEYKKKIKEYKTEGWKIDGTSRSIEVKLLQHYDKLNSGESVELVGAVSSCNSKNVCRQNALNNALTYYGSQAGSYVRGKVTSDVLNNQSGVDSEEFDKFYAAYERLVGKEIKGEVVESYAIIKDNGKSNSYEIIYLINEAAASKARIRAFEQAAKESKLAQEYAKGVSDFINDSFELENPK